MYYLRTHVFSKQKKEFEETAMAIAGEHCRIPAPTTTPRAVLPIRSILSVSKRNKCRKLLPSATVARQNELSSKLWTRTRRWRLAFASGHRRPYRLLCHLKFQQYKRPLRAKYTTIVPRTDESNKERQPTGDAVSSHRRLIDRCLKQNASSSIPVNGLCSGSSFADLRRRTTSYRMPTVALERLVRFQRNQAHPQMSQRKRSTLCLLQPRSLESIMSTR